MKAVILAGGLGTRLHSMLPDSPKAMAPIGRRPFLEYQLQWLRSHELTDIILCVGYLHQQIEDYFADGSKLGMKIRYSHEPSPLGTAGGDQTRPSPPP